MFFGIKQSHMSPIGKMECAAYRTGFLDIEVQAVFRQLSLFVILSGRQVSSAEKSEAIVHCVWLMSSAEYRDQNVSLHCCYEAMVRIFLFERENIVTDSTVHKLVK